MKNITKSFFCNEYFDEKILSENHFACFRFRSLIFQYTVKKEVSHIGFTDLKFELPSKYFSQVTVRPS